MNKYTNDVKKILKNSENEAKVNNNEFIGTEHLLLSLLKIDSDVKPIFNEYGVNYKNLVNYIKADTKKSNLNFYTPSLKKIIENAIIPNKESDVEEINVVSLTLSLLDDTTTKAYSILEKENIDIKSIYKKIAKLLIITKPNLIEELGTDITELAKKGELDKVIGREKEIERIIEILARKNKNNPILLGEAGVGKTAIVEELAKKITEGNVPSILKNKKVVSINLASIISGTKYRGEFEEKMGKIIKEIERENNIILFIDEIHTIVGAGGAEGAIDASNILKPVLARGKAKCIGATTINEYKKTIEKDKALDRRFQKVIINEPTEKETLIILKKIKKDYEKFHNVIIPNNILTKIPSLSKKYILDRNEPDKSIDILDEICAKTSVYTNHKEINNLKTKMKKLRKEKEISLKNKNFKNAINITKEYNYLKGKLDLLDYNNCKKEVTSETLKSVFEHKSNSKIYELETEKTYFQKLKIDLKEIIINQNEQIDKLINIYKSHKEKINQKPTTIFLTGQAGTGKTLMIKSLAKLTKTNLIKLNMSEYKSEISINKIIGSPQGYIGYNDTNTTFEELKLKPNSIILVENIEQANTNILNLFETLLEEGEIKNSKNETIKFSNNLIIFTSNKHNNTNKLGFIEKKEKFISKDNTFYDKIFNKIQLNALTENDIKAIIKIKNDKLTDTEINEIIEKSNFNILGASKLDTLLYELENSTTQL